MTTIRQASSGQLRHRVAFQKREGAEDGAGNYDGAFVTVFKRNARVTPLVGGEEVMAARLQGVSPASIRVRSDSSTRQVTQAWQILDITRVDGNPRNIAYNIQSKMNLDEKNIWLEFTCVSGKPG